MESPWIWKSFSHQKSHGGLGSLVVWIPIGSPKMKGTPGAPRKSQSQSTNFPTFRALKVLGFWRSKGYLTSMITWDGAMGGDDAKGFIGEDVA